MNCACWDSQLKDQKYYVMAVQTGDVAAVSEPGTLALFAIGLAAIGFARRRRTQ